MSAINPDEGGRFGDYGGRYAPETLMPALLDERQDRHTPTVAWVAIFIGDHGGWEGSIDVVIVVQGQADLLEVVAALHASRCLARRLYGGEEKRNQHRDDRRVEFLISKSAGGGHGQAWPGPLL